MLTGAGDAHELRGAQRARLLQHGLRDSVRGR